MPKFAANLTTLFNEVDFLERFGMAAKSGFKAVEFQFPYEFDKDALAGRLVENDLTPVLHNLPAGDWQAGDRGLACLPDRIGEFQDSVGQAMDYATTLGCNQLNCLAGRGPEDADPDKLEQTLVENLRFAAQQLGAAGIRLLIEPINTHDVPGFYLCHARQALSVMEQVGAPNIALQYDMYHMHIMEGDLAHTLTTILPQIAHIQISDSPGRHEPGTGEINYAFLFDFLDRVGYAGWVGCEYTPRTTTAEGLTWFEHYGYEIGSGLSMEARGSIQASKDG